MVTVTRPPVPPPAPFPPVAFASAPPPVESDPAMAKPPLPPPPPTDCARMPFDKSPTVVIEALEFVALLAVTTTSPALPAAPPLPPTVCSLDVLLLLIVPGTPIANPVPTPTANRLRLDGAGVPPQCQDAASVYDRNGRHIASITE
jgi:hypothetical protein